MSECIHKEVVTFRTEAGEPVPLWACSKCKTRFEPIGPWMEREKSLQARIEALEKDFAYHAELCTSQQARIGALTAEVEEQARLLGASGSREAELLARVEALENAAKSVAKAKGKGFAQVHKDDVPWFMHLMNRIDALAALLQEPTK